MMARRQRPSQAVILAGGRGTRLRPFTDTRPKPMIEIAGRPFLEHLIELLRSQGFDRFLVLLGYLPHVIQDHFGDGRRWGVRIQYSVTLPDDETTRRVKAAEHHIDPCFLLMYCDNYWPMQMDRMWTRFAEHDAPAMITVYSNKDGYTTNSVRVDDDGYVAVYDKTCTSPNLQGVEISYAILTKPVLDLIADDTVPFEVAVYPRLTQNRQLLAYVTHHRYYSIGSHRRLPFTHAFFTRPPTVLLDRDGVLNRKPPKAEYVRSWSEFAWLPGAREALRSLHLAGFRVVVISNQAGIARGAMTASDVEEIHTRMKKEAESAGGRIEAVYLCPHNWDDGCECRKPKPGLLFQAQRDLHLNLSRSLFIGDDDRDAQAADAAGCPWRLVSNNVSLLDIVRDLTAVPSST
jgi:histidinol-phosphate phosphatase family protein